MLFKRFSVLLLLLLSILYGLTSADDVKGIPITTEWDWPIDNFHVQENIKYGTTVENTNYGVRNLDVVLGGSDKITCYGVGSHRTFHAGVDLYPDSLDTNDLAVKAVGNGSVVYRANGTIHFPGDAIIIEHANLGGELIYSVYIHLDNGSVTVNEGDYVIKGQFLGNILPTLYEGRFPEFHPDGDDTHLHFEIRTFQDATATGLFPSECDVLGTTGASYTYPDRPDDYGYLDPLQFIGDQLPIGKRSKAIYLPLITNRQEVCQEGKDLLLPPPFNRNPGFEFPNSNSAPWHEISNFIFLTQGQPITYPFVQGNFVLSGNQSALLNKWGQPGCCGWSNIDEELVQSFHIPDGVVTADWTQLIQLRNIDPGDRFIIDLKDARTGHILANMAVIDENSGYQQNQIYQITYPLSGALAGRDVSLSYSSISDNDTSETNLVLDNVSFITHCGTANDLETQAIQIEEPSFPLP